MDAQTRLTADLNEASRRQNWPAMEATARDWLARQRFFFPHLCLIHALLKQNRQVEADAEFEILFSYKFNLADRIGQFPEVETRYRDRMSGHFVMSTMRPGMGFEADAWTLDVRRWHLEPLGSARENFLAAGKALLDEVIPPQALADSKAASICTFGSCFAANLTKMMVSQGLNASNLLIEESVNSTFANRILMEIVAGSGGSKVHQEMEAAFGAEFFQTVRNKLVRASHIVLTVGVAPTFFSVADGSFVFAKNYGNLLRAGSIRMRTTTCAENIVNLHQILALMDRISPRSRKIITVSPVPLMATAEMPSAIMADCVSKSTLRAAVHETVAADPGLVYFPAFEIVRWLSSYTGAEIFGADDRDTRHVSNWVVEFIVSSFIERFFTAER